MIWLCLKPYSSLRHIRCFPFYKIRTLPPAQSKGCCWVTLDICFNIKAPTPLSRVPQVTWQSLIHRHTWLFLTTLMGESGWVTEVVARKGNGHYLQWHRRWQPKLIQSSDVERWLPFWSVVQPQPTPMNLNTLSLTTHNFIYLSITYNLVTTVNSLYLLWPYIPEFELFHLCITLSKLSEKFFHYFKLIISTVYPLGYLS